MVQAQARVEATRKAILTQRRKDAKEDGKESGKNGKKTRKITAVFAISGFFLLFALFLRLCAFA